MQTQLGIEIHQPASIIVTIQCHDCGAPLDMTNANQHDTNPGAPGIHYEFLCNDCFFKKIHREPVIISETTFTI